MYICMYVYVCVLAHGSQRLTPVSFSINFYPTYLETGLLIVPELGLTISARLVGQIAS